ncbi:MAG TPA: hypothetical protein VKU02_28405, partial [Gemmataceae bacterium]|nr:hypothetical protein [Gemmataceae bacterium]
MCLRVLPRIALLLFVLSMFWVCFPAGASAADGGASSVLFLNDGGYLPGELHGSDDPKVLRWRSPCFAQPFEFPMTAVKAVQYPAPGPQPKPVGEYCFELVNDDVLYGNVLRWTGDEVALESVRIGRVHLRREQIRRFYLWKGADAIYLGPNGLAGWTDSAATPHWRDEGGQLVTDQPGASLYGALGIPEKAMIEVELSWKGAPDFVLALGVEDREAAVSNAFHLEVWDGELVVVGESARDADVASIQPVGTGEGHVRLQIYLDQAQQRLHLLSRGGKPLATLHVDAKNGPIHPGVRLTNKKGDVRLEHLRITSWNGLPPREIREEQSRLHRTDGSIVYGQITGFDPDSKQFTFRDGKTETRIEQAAILDVFLAPSVAVAKAPADTAAGSPKGTVRAVYRDGWRISGTLTRIEDTHLTLNSPGVKEPLRLPLAGLRSLIALNSPGGTASIPAVAGRAGRMEMEGVHLNGRLVKGTEQPDGSCLVWHPELALNASPLLPGESGRIVYRDPPQPKPSVPEGQRTVIMQGGARVIL